MKRFFKWALGIIDVALIAVLTIVFVRAFDARSKPPLEKWHGTLASEVRARDLGPGVGLSEYVRREDALFDEMRRTILGPGPVDARHRLHREAAEAVRHPLPVAH